MMQRHWELGFKISFVFNEYKAEYKALAVMDNAIESRWLK